MIEVRKADGEIFCRLGRALSGSHPTKIADEDLKTIALVIHSVDPSLPRRG